MNANDQRIDDWAQERFAEISAANYSQAKRELTAGIRRQRLGYLGIAIFAIAMSAITVFAAIYLGPVGFTVSILTLVLGYFWSTVRVGGIYPKQLLIAKIQNAQNAQGA